MSRSRYRISTRGLMILTAVVGVDAAVVIQAARVGSTIEFTLFIAAAMVTLNLFFASYLKAADRINAAPPEKQTEMILTLGCLVLVMMALLVPVVIVILLRASG
jgi:heme/copper-type cytochrome/quinol oxidase subunit 3